MSCCKRWAIRWLIPFLPHARLAWGMLLVRSVTTHLSSWVGLPEGSGTLEAGPWAQGWRKGRNREEGAGENRCLKRKVREIWEGYKQEGGKDSFPCLQLS